MDALAQRFYGIYPAVCWDNADPEKRNRIRVKVPMVLGDSVSGWADRCSDWNSPPINAVVWVMFVAGDPDHPVWLGTP